MYAMPFVRSTVTSCGVSRLKSPRFLGLLALTLPAARDDHLIGLTENLVDRYSSIYRHVQACICARECWYLQVALGEVSKNREVIQV
jgi:hypothetical protein